MISCLSSLKNTNTHCSIELSLAQIGYVQSNFSKDDLFYDCCCNVMLQSAINVYFDRVTVDAWKKRLD